MIQSGPVAVEVRSSIIGFKNTSKEEFEKSIDDVCDLLKRYSDDIFHFVQNYYYTDSWTYSLWIHSSKRI